ncbi:putative F-box/LRR-repeat protein [Acorus calamus]|uniref:F-box/LRR-repeat protein n=1 Tax=Acorus calamus TaxID=4465 RepID=A0AAV9FD17_ACOCL|nr:putative F-box/LRR-repeat protein [Acorus calamus]
MRDAVRASVLSNKWRYLALFYPNLNFESNNILRNRFSVQRFDKLDDNGRAEFVLEKKLNFVRAVDHFFEFRPYGVKMKSHRICLSLDVDHESHLDQWIELAFLSDIESLNLTLSEFIFDKPDHEKLGTSSIYSKREVGKYPEGNGVGWLRLDLSLMLWFFCQRTGEGRLVITSRPGWGGYFLVAAPIMTCQTSHL